MNRHPSLSIEKNSGFRGTDYETYEIGKKEWLLYGGQGILFTAVLSFVFYRSIPVFLILAPVGACCPFFIKNQLKEKRKEELKLQFRDVILSAASGLRAGYSVEHAFRVASAEAERIYGKDSMIVREVEQMLSKTGVNRTFEDAFEDFAARSGIEDIQSFADVFLAARKSGGELMKIIARTAEIIAEKIRIQEDIRTATAEKRMEQRIMSGIPVLIVIYIELTSPGFFDVLYTTGFGRILMTVCMGVYLGSCWLARRLLEIPV